MINYKLHEIILNDQIAVSARVSLIEGNWNEALIQYKTLFRKGNSSIKLQSFIGIICAIFRKDFEWVSVITCKPKLRGVRGNGIQHYLIRIIIYQYSSKFKFSFLKCF